MPLDWSPLSKSPIQQREVNCNRKNNDNTARNSMRSLGLSPSDIWYSNVLISMVSGQRGRGSDRRDQSSLRLLQPIYQVYTPQEKYPSELEEIPFYPSTRYEISLFRQCVNVVNVTVPEL